MLAAMRMLDVHSPITDGATLILSCYTAMNVDRKLLVTQLKLDLAGQLPRGGTAGGAAASPRCAPEGSVLLAPRRSSANASAICKESCDPCKCRYYFPLAGRPWPFVPAARQAKNSIRIGYGKSARQRAAAIG
jgi:hypothetical protein